MDGSNPRQQRASLSFPYLGQFSDALSLNDQASFADLDMDDWKLFDIQSPQVLDQDQTDFGGFHHPSDDFCAHSTKDSTVGPLGNHGSGASSHMPLHSHPFDSHMVTSHHHQMHGDSPAPGSSSLNFADFAASSFFPQRISSSTPRATKRAFGAGLGRTSFAHTSALDQEDFADQLSALSSPKRAVRDGDDDVESTCDSDCGQGEICHDAACSEDPAGCCEDETCLQNTPPSSGDAMSSEDAIAAVALTSFVDQNLQMYQLRQQQALQNQSNQQQNQALARSSAIHSHQGHHQHHHSGSSSSTPSCLQLGLGPDMCISPQFLMNYQHLREAHNPLQPSSCTASFCPIEDPNFYQECHIRHMPNSRGSFFDNIDLNMMMSNIDHSHTDGIECGAKFPNGEAMIQHLWNEHRASMNLLQYPAVQQQAHLAQTPGLVSSASSSVSLSSQDLARIPSLLTSMQDANNGLALPDASMSLPVQGSFDQSHSFEEQEKQADTRPNKMKKEKELKLETQKSKSAQIQQVQQAASQKYECFWCDTAGGQPCGQTFEAAGDLHKHVLAAHTHLLKRDVGGTYSCGWLGCTRRDGEEKGGFAQKSKIDRHMQVHTGNKPFLCDICHQSFSANQALLQHKLIHEDSKPLSCDICGKTFRQHSALTMHIRTHTKVRPLKCPYCNKEFSESSNLSKHKRIHTGEGQYECTFPGCKRTFHRKDQLRRHGAQHTKGVHAQAIDLPLSGE